MNKKSQEPTHHIPKSLKLTLKIARKTAGLNQEDIYQKALDLNSRYLEIKDEKKALENCVLNDDEKQKKKERLARKVGVQKGNISKIENGGGSLKYGHLEIFEDVYNYPTGLILLTSHIFSYMRESKVDEAFDMVKRLESFCLEIKKQAKNIKDDNPTDLREIAKIQHDCIENLFNSYKNPNNTDKS